MNLHKHILKILILYLFLLVSYQAYPKEQPKNDKQEPKKEPIATNSAKQTKTSDINRTLSLLEDQFTGIKSISADFVQKKKMSLFNKEIVLKGKMNIRFPHYFRWEVDEPVKTIVTADGDTIKIWDEETDKTQTTSTKNNPVLKNIWAQVDSWFMGKYKQLANDYNIEISKTERSVGKIPVVVFIPKSAPLTTVMKSVTLFFSDPSPTSAGRCYLRKVILKDKSGDSTVMEFLKTKILLLENEN